MALTSRRRHWDRRAPTYDASMDWVERRLFKDTRPWVARRAQGHTLEVAIGTGANLPHYPPEVELTGTDFSGPMLDLARVRAQQLGRSVTLHQADAMGLPFADASFDCVVSTFSLCCVPRERTVIGEMLRVLRPGGQLLLADHVPSSRWPLRGLQRMADLVTVPWHGEHFSRRPLSVLRGMGVTVVETERLSQGIVERVHAVKAA
jgi:ubiquinone/menaquinone biosynthesis C-methylase UbiE